MTTQRSWLLALTLPIVVTAFVARTTTTTTRSHCRQHYYYHENNNNIGSDKDNVQDGGLSASILRPQCTRIRIRSSPILSFSHRDGDTGSNANETVAYDEASKTTTTTTTTTTTATTSILLDKPEKREPSRISGSEKNDEKLELAAVQPQQDQELSFTSSTTITNDDGENEGQQAQAVWYLNAVAIIWGTQHAVIKSVVEQQQEPTAFDALDAIDATTTTTFDAATAATTTLDAIQAVGSSGTDLLSSTTTSSLMWTPALFTFLRFALAALLASPYTPGLQSWWQEQQEQQQQQQQPHDNDTSSSSSHQTEVPFSHPDTSATAMATTTSPSTTTVWRWGAELGGWMFLGFAFQAIGLLYTTAQKSAFLLYLNVKFVPLFAALLFGRNISATTWASAAMALAGTGLLAVGSSTETATTTLATTAANQWNVGDLWSIAAAMASAMFILRMEQASAAVSSSPPHPDTREAAAAAAPQETTDIGASELNAACLWVVTALSALWTTAIVATQPMADPTTIMMTQNDDMLVTDTFSLVSSQALDMLQHSWPAFLYLSGIATAVCNWLQTKAQRHVSAERACVIYAMDPVYGALFSAWWLGESLPGTAGYLGAGLITVAAATNAFLDPTTTSKKDTKDEGEDAGSLTRE